MTDDKLDEGLEQVVKKIFESDRKGSEAMINLMVSDPKSVIMSVITTAKHDGPWVTLQNMAGAILLMAEKHKREKAKLEGART